MKTIIWLLFLLSSTAFASQDHANIYVSNPDTRRFDIVWEGSGPKCHEGTSTYDTYGWTYGMNDAAIRVLIKSRKTKAVVCTIDIDDSLQGPFPRARGDCYVIHSDPVGHGFDTSWITLYEAAPYRSKVCE